MEAIIAPGFSKNQCNILDFLKIFFPVIQEVLIKLIIFSFFIADSLNPGSIDAINGGVRTGQENGGMGSDNKLSMACGTHGLDNLKKFEESLRREGSFRFIQKIDPGIL